uniref:Reverse transcriptase/retrotransposon-derived protein RNase H-like domain-containing protein n=1 Tax=Cyprinus carpio TaxID=7962 RepID=A0A8C1XZR3_CYPCA
MLHWINLTDHKTLPNTQLHWTDEVEVHFNAWKQAITTAPTLGLPDYGKVFHLHAQETEVVAIGVLLQQHGPTYRPVAYLSKKLDNVASGMPRKVSENYYMYASAYNISWGSNLAPRCPSEDRYKAQSADQYGKIDF